MGRAVGGASRMRRSEVEQPLAEDEFTGQWPEKVRMHLTPEEILGQPGQDDPWFAKPSSIAPAQRRRGSVK